MTSKKKIILLILLFLFAQNDFKICAQTEKPYFRLDTDESGTNKLYKARNYIVLKNNFRYQPNSSNVSFKACIDTTLVFFIKSISNPAPDSITNPEYDAPYVPENSHGTDNFRKQLNESETPTHGAGLSIVTYPVLWFKTMPLTNNLNGYYYWKEIMDGEAKMFTDYVPEVDEEFVITRNMVRAFNFNPAIDLSTTVVSNRIRSQNSNFSHSTIMGVWGPKQNIEEDQFIFAIHGRRNESLVFTKETVTNPVFNEPAFSFGNDTARNFLYRNISLEQNDSVKFKETALRISTVFKSEPLNSDIWGENYDALIQIGGNFDTARVNTISKFNPSLHNYPAFKGYTPELLLFDKILSEKERSVYETYLAIKYGITLDQSYVNRNSEVIWDHESNQQYHNRVIAYAREDDLGLLQKTSTTAYEKAPYITTLSSGDSYDSCDSYNSASQNKLLVIGTQPGNTLVNGQYFVLGDNNDSLTASVNLNSGYTILKRKWKLSTNQVNNTKPQSLQWNKTDLSFFAGETERFDILKTADKPLGYARTVSTLMDSDGYFSWKVGQENGPLTIKFSVSPDVTSYHEKDYGYHVTIDGQVLFVNKGVVVNQSLFTVEKGQKIEIEKHGRVIYLRVDGVRYKETELIIDSINAKSDFYGSVVIGDNLFDIWLKEFTVGGFHDNGNRIELSYNLIPDMAPHKDGNAYLLVDRNGQGNFQGSVDYYLADEVDIHRKKIIFNNILWDNDNNNSDVFTFGFNQVNLHPIIKRPALDDNPDPDLTDEIKVYYHDPSDFSKLIVMIQTIKPTPAKILIYDISGRLISTQELLESAGTRYEEISLPNNGVYVVRVVTNEMRVTQKVISKK